MKSQPGYLTFIDSLRAVAVVAVILYHLDPRLLPGGFVGVDIFFVISGFVVSRSVSTAKDGSFFGFLTYFYSRRLLRIMPALAVCLLLTTLATVLFIPFAWLSSTSQRTGMAAFFGFSNFILAATSDDYFSPRAEFNSFTHTWSLGVEEQYYLIFPLVFILWLRGRAGLSGIVLAVLATVSLALAIPATAAQPDRAFYLIHYRFWELAAGALLFQTMEQRPIRTGALAGAVLSMLAIGFALITASPRSTPFPGAILPVLGTLGVILCFRALPASSRLLRLSAHPVPVYLGRISYSLYLWHWPVFVLLRWTAGLDSVAAMVIALLLTFAAAALSYRWVETPPRRSPRLARLPRIAIVGIGLAAAGIGWAGASGIWALRPLISFSTVSRHPGDWFGYRMVNSPGACRLVVKSYPIANGAAQSLSRGGCDAPVTLDRHLYVIGDSHSTAYEVMVRQTVMDTGARAEHMSAGGCGTLNLIDAESPACHAFRTAAFDAVLATAAPGDVIFLPALRLPRISDQFGFFGESAARAHISDPQTQALRAEQEAAFAELLHTLAARRIHVVLEAPPPVFAAPAFRCADWFNQANPICAGGLTIARATIDDLRAPVLLVFARQQALAANLHVWDPLPLLCPAATCAVMRAGRPVYFDRDHLSGYGNTVLVPEFESFLASLPAP